MITDLPIATSVRVEASTDGTKTGLIFQVKSGQPVGVAFPNTNLTQTIALLLNHAAEQASKSTPSAPSKNLTTTPVLAADLSVAQGRDDREAILAFHVGNLVVSFAIDAAKLHGMCSHFLSKTTKVAPRKRH